MTLGPAWVIKLARGLFCFGKDLHTFHTDRVTLPNGKFSEVSALRPGSRGGRSLLLENEASCKKMYLLILERDEGVGRETLVCCSA